MASGQYNYFKGNCMGAVYNLASGGDVLKAMLLNASHTFDPDDQGYADVSANEITGTGYSATGLTLTGQAVSVDNTNDRGVFTCTSPQWPSATFNCDHTVWYSDTPTTPVADPLFLSFDFGGNESVTAGTFTLTVPAGGVLNID